MSATTPGLSAAIRHMFGWALVHTYTRVPTVAVLEIDDVTPRYDDWGQALVEPGPPVPGNPCLLVFQEQTVTDQNGTLVVHRPLVRVLSSDPLAPGDVVEQIRDRAGTLLLARAAVLRVRPAPNWGESITRTAELELAESIAGLPEAT